ncbi:unnamed protein product [Ilex paraguariensis]|uniref:Nuclear transcription factor Y subunit n=1 Tax=Ilex paraguariensis TaxID=185542 RepID=A0ABC8R5V1_9AQUA
MRRARGSGGRFLNTKKLDSNATNHMSEEEPKSGANVSAQQGETRRTVEDMNKALSLSNVNDGVVTPTVSAVTTNHALMLDTLAFPHLLNVFDGGKTGGTDHSYSTWVAFPTVRLFLGNSFLALVTCVLLGLR